MNKITNTTPNLTEKNIDKIAELFPQVVTELEGDGGAPTRAIDFDLLRQALSDSLVEGADERYRLDWPGKRASLLKANTPIAKTLRPDRASSVEFDTTENVFIEGDNFEALKILQESYLGKVKMIYIDPPYNTGKDFVYSDNFTQNKAEYEEEIEAVDEEGNKMFRENTRTNPRFHSDWLSMMYERLTIARDLLKDDGVIFISIDDNEIHNLRKICDEIFGESNFISQVTVLSNPRGSQSSKYLAEVHEYILMYARSSSLKINSLPLSPETISEYKYIEGKRHYRLLGLRQRGGAWRREQRPKMFFPVYVNPENGSVSLEQSSIYNVEVLPKRPTGEESRWGWGKEKFIAESGLLIGKVVNEGGPNEKYDIFRKDYLEDENGIVKGARPKTLWDDKKFNYQNGRTQIESLFSNSETFDFPKPTAIIGDPISFSTTKDDIILDFFSGSATTAHAVMAQNAEDGGTRKFIMVQLAEETSSDSEAFKAGYRTIAELGRERIRRAAAKIKADYAEELAERATPLDTGFRAYTVADSAFLDVERHPTELEQGQLLELANNIKSDRTPEDLLTQVMLELGLTLDLPIETKQVDVNTVFYVAGNALVACFDEAIPTTLIDEMAKCQPLQVAFKDGSFGSDDALINAETHLKRLSPDTILSVI